MASPPEGRLPRQSDGQRITDFGAAPSPQGTTLTEQMFLTHLHRGMDKSGPKMIDIAFCKLRKKLAAARGEQDIEAGDDMCGALFLRGARLHLDQRRCLPPHAERGCQILRR